MKVKDAFKVIRKGVNIKTSKYITPTSDMVAKTFNKNAINYGSVISSRFEDVIISKDIEGSFILQQYDIIISIKKPYRVGFVMEKLENTVIVTSNFIILRGLDHSYSEVFVANYLDKIGINKYVEDVGITDDLSKIEIENIELPDLSFEKQNKIREFLTLINKRSSKYATLLDNDSAIVEGIINHVIGDVND